MSQEFDDQDIGHLLPTLDEGPGPARRASQQRQLSIVQGVLDTWMGARGARPLMTARSRQGGARPRAAKLLAVGVVLLGGAAAAHYLVRTPARPDSPPIPSAPSSARAMRAALSVASPPEPEAPETSATEPPPSAADRPASAEPAPPAQQPAPSAQRPAPPRTAEDWLQRANEFRARKQWAQAEAAYSRVYRAEPRSGAAYVARVAAATIRMDHLGDPAGARRLLQSAAAGGAGGMLDVEVLVGIAQASRRLGDAPAERRALAELVRRHEGTRAARRAEERLAELGEHR